MSKTRATPEAVQSATKTLMANGVEPTADGILAITGGSKNTVIHQMKAAAAQRISPLRALPEKIDILHRAAVISTWNLASELADRDIEVIKNETAADLLSMQEKLDSSQRVVQQLQKDQDAKDRQLESFRQQIVEERIKAKQVDVLRAQIEDLQRQVNCARSDALRLKVSAAGFQGEIKALTSIQKNSRKTSLPPKGLR